MCFEATHDLSPRIAVLQGAERETIQRVLAEFAERRSRRGVRVAGLVEHGAGCSPGCRSLSLRDIAGGETYSISQDLGPGSTACNFDPGGLAAACAAVERSISRGVDIVILSKFGKQEAMRSGLCDAFRAAIVSRSPIVTAVAPTLMEPWGEFAGGLFEIVKPGLAALENWWHERSVETLRVAAE